MSATSRNLALPLALPFLALLVLAYLLPGLVGHDPWKPQDAIGIGIVHQMLLHGQWIVPHLAGEPFLGDGPFHYWIAALSAKLTSPFLALHDGARLASAIMMALTLAFLHLAGRELYGKTEGVSAGLALLGCLGLLVHAHETLAEIGMLAGQALAWYGIALFPRKPRRAGWLLGTGLAAAGLSKGIVAVVAPISIALIAPLLSQAWRRREYLLAVLTAAVLFFAICGGWLAILEYQSRGLVAAWWNANAMQFERPALGSLGYWGETLAWATWPAWPLALWTLWERRHRAFEPGTRMLGAACVLSLLVLLSLRDPHEVYALPLLLPLSLLAGAGISSLRRGAANALSWFGVMTAGFLGALMWLGWFAMMTGVPGALARSFSRLEPGFTPRFSWMPFAVALALTFCWLWLLLKSERSVYRGLTFWAAGMALLWGLAMTLILPWIDYGKSYRSVAESLQAHIPPGALCVESHGLGEPQRAVLDYHAGVLTRRLERTGGARCPVLLVQFREGQPERFESGWKLLWEGRRPRDQERYRLYQRQP